MKKKLITAIALSLCVCSLFSACGKKDEATETAPDTTVAMTEDKPADADTPVAVTDTTATATPDTSVAVAVGEAVAEDITADMTDEQREFYIILMKLGTQAFELRDMLNQGASIDELSDGEGEEAYIKMVCEDAAGSISNTERREKATEVFINHFWEIADNYDYQNSEYPEWETLYNEYAGGSTGM
ncbi:hypothetical protein SAMN02910370_02604 [Lachnospiraceae bacterium XPB1003]|nr:hypothetical protein SAMN02910370_02604 [Lachnospiraceae bacterium XPB1003]